VEDLHSTLKRGCSGLIAGGALVRQQKGGGVLVVGEFSGSMPMPMARVVEGERVNSSNSEVMEQTLPLSLGLR
jgi:hypothetical protein